MSDTFPAPNILDEERPLAFRRRAVLGSGLALLAANSPLAASAQELLPAPIHDTTYIDDFDELWQVVNDRYCYFQDKKTDWEAVRRLYRPFALKVDSPDAFKLIVDAVLREVYDPHTSRHATISADHPPSPYLDLWVEPQADGLALVTSVREGCLAQARGIKVGDRIVSVNGLSMLGASAPFLPTCLAEADPAATSYAMNIAVSERFHPRTFRLQEPAGRQRTITLQVNEIPDPPDLTYRTLPGGYGYIAINSFADKQIVPLFDAALQTLARSPGLVLDVRNNLGGDTALAKPIMGRFIKETKPYAHMRRRDGVTLGPFWTEVVESRGPFTYTGPVVVLTSRWSASMAEGFPMGMRSIGRATIVGTEMMRVGAAVYDFHLDRTGIQGQYSAEPVYDAQFRPRRLLVPDVPVSGGSDILAAGLAVLRRGRAAQCCESADARTKL